MTAEEGLRTVVIDCLNHVRSHEAGVVAGDAPESVHQMRVGLRRLKCALQLFAAARPLWRAQRDDLDWLADTLGGARDWDVLAHDTLARLDAHPDADRAALLQVVRRVAREKLGAAADAVGSARYRHLVRSVQAWIAGAHWRDARSDRELDALRASLAPLADRRLARLHGRLIERGHGRGLATATRRHRVRIDAKKLRYATGFFQVLYPASRVAHFTDALAALQDALGALNDVVVARGLLRGLADDEPALASAAQSAIRALARGKPRRRHALDHAWHGFVRARPPWSRDRART